MDTTSVLIQALTEQNELLRQLLAATNKPKLGLHDNAGTVKIFCNRSNGCNWYTFNNGTVNPVNSTALTGYLKNLEFQKCTRRDKETWKLLTTIQADRTYILESGYDSHFTKSLLSAIASLTPDQLLTPVTISPKPGDDDVVLFARVWIGSEYIKGEYSQDSDFREIAKRAIACVKAANGQEF